jgi:hypothetical protein
MINVDSELGSAGSSTAATGKGAGFAPRRAARIGAGSPIRIHPHVVSETLWIRAEDFAMPAPARYPSPAAGV